MKKAAENNGGKIYICIPFEKCFGTCGISSAAPPFLIHRHMLFASEYLVEPRKR
jgi:hypothetical protein